MSIEIEDITVDTSDVKAAIEEVSRLSDITARNVLGVARRGVQLMALYTSGSRNAVVQGATMMAQASILAGQAMVTLAEAQAITVLGAINAVLSFSAAISLFAQGVHLAAFARSASSQFDNIDRSIQAANILFAGW